MSVCFSVVLIARNEAYQLPRLVTSLQEFLARGGEIVILDTGSTDGTAEVARNLGCKVEEVGDRFRRKIVNAAEINQVFVAEGEEPILKDGDSLFDFSSARNYAATLASNDFIATPDCDEIYTKFDIDVLERTIRDGTDQLEYNFVFAHDAEGRETIKFLHSKFYNRTKLKWRGIIHEYLALIGGETKRTFLPETVIKLEHWQNPQTNRSGYLKGLAYDCWLDPTNDRNAHYFGRELVWCGRPKSAIKQLQRHLEIGKWPAERAQSMIYVGDAYRMLNQPDEALQWYQKSFHEDPHRRAALLRMSQHFYELGKPQETACYAMAALQIEKSSNYYADHEEDYQWKPHEHLYWALWQIGQKQRAHRHFEEAFRWKPYEGKYLHDMRFSRRLPKVSILLPTLNRPEGVKRCLESIKNSNYPQELIEVLVVEDNPRLGVPRRVAELYEKSSGEMIIFASDDFEFTHNTIPIAVLEAESHGLVAFNTGPVMPDEGNICEHFLIRRDLVQTVGGVIFDLDFNHLGGDNLLWAKCKVLGEACRSEKAVAIHHHFSKTGAPMDSTYHLAGSKVKEDLAILRRKLSEVAPLPSYSDIFASCEKRAAAEDLPSIFSHFRERHDLFHFLLPVGKQAYESDREALDIASQIDPILYGKYFNKKPPLVGYGLAPHQTSWDTVESRHIMMSTLIFSVLKEPLGHIVEIGGGYGNWRWLNEGVVDFKKWTIIDLPFVSQLQSWYLNQVGASPTELVTTEEYLQWSKEQRKIDLVIGAHSLSEFSWETFCSYFDNVICKSRWLFWAAHKDLPNPQIIKAKLEKIERDFEKVKEVWSESKQVMNVLYRRRNKEVDSKLQKSQEESGVEDLTSRIKQGIPFTYTKMGDGEILAMSGKKGANYAGEKYEQLGPLLRTAYKIICKKKGMITRSGPGVVEEQKIVEKELEVACNSKVNLLNMKGQLNQSIYDFWEAVKKSKRPKVFVGPSVLKKAVDFLDADNFVEIPAGDCYNSSPKIPEIESSIVVFCAGMSSKIWIAALLNRLKEVTCIDAGSAFDNLFVCQTREEQESIDEVRSFYRNLLPRSASSTLSKLAKIAEAVTGNDPRPKNLSQLVRNSRNYDKYRWIYQTVWGNSPEELDDISVYYKFLYSLCSELKPQLSVEIGTLFGWSAAHLGEGHSHGKVISVDVDYQACCRGNELAASAGIKNVEFFHGNSADLLRRGISDIDILFIDGDHSYRSTLFDFQTLLPRVRRGGVILVDDISLNDEMKIFWSEVKQPKIDLSALHRTGFGAYVKE